MPVRFGLPWRMPVRQPCAFADRVDAGRTLARELMHYANRCDTIVLGLARGGVPVAFEVAAALNARLDTFVVRKLGVPRCAELAMGAIASDGALYLNAALVAALGVDEGAIEAVVRRERGELQRRERMYRGARPFPELRDRVVILVDDGLATGASMRVAVRALRAYGPARIVAAAPVAAPQIDAELGAEVDETAFAFRPESFDGVGRYYTDFEPTHDSEVQRLLRRGRERKIGWPAARSDPEPALHEGEEPP